MHKEQVTVQNFTPAEFEQLIQNMTSEEGFTVQRNDVDDFSAHQGPNIHLQFHYNRNQNVLVVLVRFSKWNPAVDKEFVKEQVLRVTGKDDATDQVQPVPLQGTDPNITATGVNQIKTPPVAQQTPPAPEVDNKDDGGFQDNPSPDNTGESNLPDPQSSDVPPVTNTNPDIPKVTPVPKSAA
jgi:hypothetical protein